MNMQFLYNVRVLMFIVISSVNIHLSVSGRIYDFASSFPQKFYNALPFRKTSETRVSPITERTDYLTGTCEKWDQPADCSPRGMVYYQHPVEGCESLGFCDCDQGGRSNNRCKDFPVRMKIYMPEGNRCYPVFSQGPCKRRDWLIFDEKEYIGKCVRNPCFPRGLDSNFTGRKFWFYDPRIGRCQEALTQGYCPIGKTLEVVHDSPYPQCTDLRPRSCPDSSISVRSPLACRSGTRYSTFLKKCRSSLRRQARIG